jgi:hypothetical protein
MLFEAEVEFPLRLTVSQSIRLGIEPLPGARDLISVKILIIPDTSTRALWHSFTSSHIVAKQGKHGEGMAVEFCLQSISFILVGFFNMP